MEIRKGRGLLEFRGHGGRAFGISKVRGGVKMFTPPVVGCGYFLESPNGV